MILFLHLGKWDNLALNVLFMRFQQFLDEHGVTRHVKIPLLIASDGMHTTLLGERGRTLSKHGLSRSGCVCAFGI